MKKPYAYALLVASACLLQAGCASYSGIAPEFKAREATTLGIPSSGAAESNWPDENWYIELHDPVLAGLITHALQDSPNLQAVTAKLTHAKAASGIAESVLWPQVNASASTTRERFSERGQTPAPYAGTTQSINDLQMAAQWDLDFFGKNRENLKAALGEIRATEAEYHAARALLITNIARDYYTLARLTAQRELMDRLATQRSELGKLVEKRFKAGLETRIELETSHGAVQETGRDTASLDEQIDVVRHALAALTGQGPGSTGAIAPELPAALALPVPESLPANLLGHRPDVAAARWRVESTLHSLDAAKAQFYPNINLRTFAGFSSIGFDHWIDAGSRQPGIGLAITLPVFDSGRLRNMYRSASAQVDSAIASYNGILLDAVRDVADQLSTLKAVEQQIARQHEALSSAERSYALAQKRYGAGISDRLAVLNAEARFIAQQRIAVDLQARWIDTRLRLVNALGGGFLDTEALELAKAVPPPQQTSN